MKLLGFLKHHKGAVAVIFVLLMIQAAASLLIPNLTSQIVDVGIQQYGVESVAVDEMTEATHSSLETLLSDNERTVFDESYERTAAGAWRLNGYGQAHHADLDQMLALPLTIIHGATELPGNVSFSEVMDRYHAGEYDRERVLELEREAASSTDLTDEVLYQRGIAAARAEYEALGYNMTDRQIGFLIRVGLLMLLLTAITALASIATGFVASRTGASIGYELREQLFTHVVSFNEREINRFSAASLITRGTNDIQLIQNVTIMTLRMVLYSPILAAGGIVMVMITNPSMGWIIVVAIACLFALIGVVFKLANPKFRIMQKLIDKVNLVSRELITGLPVIRAFCREGYEEARFDDASTNLMRTQLFTNRVMTFMMPTMNLILNATTVAIVWIGGAYVDLGTIQTGDLIAFITYAMVIIMGFLMIGMISIMLPRANVAAERVYEVITCEPAVDDPATPQSVGAEAGAEVEFDHVSFSYGDEEDDTDELVLEDVSFCIPPGQTLAIIGATGSGKTTVLKLLERFFDVDSGAVKIDGADIRDLTLHDVRMTFGYVPQQAWLFSGTVLSNVSYSDPEIGLDRVEFALNVAQALDFVNEFDEGVDTAIAQGGTNVSGGQRQRLAIARALAADRRVYLFDDAFSALDYKTDAALRAGLETELSGSTRIIVAQRISTIRAADTIVVLDEGRVVGIGAHDELMQTCDTYREIAHSQLSPQELGEVNA